MSDLRLRELERKAAGGDPEAKLAYNRARERHGIDVLDSVRHWLGVSLSGRKTIHLVQAGGDNVIRSRCGQIRTDMWSPTTSLEDGAFQGIISPRGFLDFAWTPQPSQSGEGICKTCLASHAKMCSEPLNTRWAVQWDQQIRFALGVRAPYPYLDHLTPGDKAEHEKIKQDGHVAAPRMRAREPSVFGPGGQFALELRMERP